MSESALDVWNKATEDEAPPLDVAAMDELVKKYHTLRLKYEEAKKLSNEAHATMELARNEVLAALQNAKKTKYFVDGIGTVYKVVKTVFSTPKDPSKKKLLADYILNKYGERVLWDKFTVNHQTLNSFCSSELEAVEDPVFQIPGVDAPTSMEDVSLRKV